MYAALSYIIRGPSITCSYICHVDITVCVFVCQLDTQSVKVCRIYNTYDMKVIIYEWKLSKKQQYQAFP